MKWSNTHSHHNLSTQVITQPYVDNTAIDGKHQSISIFIRNNIIYMQIQIACFIYSAPTNSRFCWPPPLPTLVLILTLLCQKNKKKGCRKSIWKQKINTRQVSQVATWDPDCPKIEVHVYLYLQHRWACRNPCCTRDSTEHAPCISLVHLHLPWRPPLPLSPGVL